MVLDFLLNFFLLCPSHGAPNGMTLAQVRGSQGANVIERFKCPLPWGDVEGLLSSCGGTFVIFCLFWPCSPFINNNDPHASSSWLELINGTQHCRSGSPGWASKVSDTESFQFIWFKLLCSASLKLHRWGQTSRFTMSKRLVMTLKEWQSLGNVHHALWTQYK